MELLNPENITMAGKISESNRHPGRLIVFEGADGCGKTTQLQRLYEWLSQKPFPSAPSKICRTNEPGSTALGQQLRNILLTPTCEDQIVPTAELLLYAADRAQHVQVKLLPKLKQGEWILCDRYCDSTVAYQGFGRGLELSLIEQLNHIATSGLASDLTLWLDLPVEETLARLQRRGSPDRMERDGLTFLHRVHNGFQWLAKRHGDRIVCIDASGDEAIVASRIQTAVLQRFAPENLPLQ